MDRDSDTIFFRESKKLWLSAQAQGAPPLQDGEGLFAAVNEWRASQSWPLCTDMLPVAPPMCDQKAMVSPEMRSLWQMGVLQCLKGDNAGTSVLRRALKPLLEQSDTFLGKLAVMWDNILEENLLSSFPHARQQCFARFDRLLKPTQPKSMEHHFLWADLVYYVHQDLALLDEDKLDLNKRIQTVANAIADLLVVKNTEEKIKKTDIFPHYLSLTDGLLLGGHDKLLSRVEALYNALDPHMLKIAVPVQKLWAQCTNIKFLTI